MRWHHYAGLIFGLATFTWILSGCLSLDPWSWHPGTSPTQQQREAVAGGSLQLNPLTMARVREGIAAIASSSAPKELDVVQFQGEPFLVAYRAPSADHIDQWPDDPSEFLSSVLLLAHRVISTVAPEHGAFTRFDDGAVRAAARAAMPGAAVEDEVWLEDYDAYYFMTGMAHALFPSFAYAMTIRHARGSIWIRSAGRSCRRRKDSAASTAGCITDCIVSTSHSCTTVGRSGTSS